MEEATVKYTIEIGQGLRDVLDTIKKMYSESSNGAIKISYFEASNILAERIDKIGGIKQNIKLI